MKTLFACVRYCVLTALAVLVGCVPMPIKTPAADQPELISANVRGQRVCGSYTNDNGNFNFVCDPLPTKIGTGWLLTPVRYPHPTQPNVRVINTGVVFTVTTPSLTSLEIAVRQGTRRTLLPQIAPGLGTPRPVGDSGQAEVSASDNGNGKTWTIAMRMPTCSQKREIEILNIDGSGGRSNPLIIHLLRGAAEEERVCPLQGSPGTGNPTPPIVIGEGEPFEPVPPPPSGPCPGAQPRTMFMVCKSCGSSIVDRSWFGIEACSFAEVKQITGFDPVSATNRSCTLTQSSVDCTH
jgi:hypothetical protein